MLDIKNILNEGYTEPPTGDGTTNPTSSGTSSGGTNYEFVNSLLSSSGNNTDLTDPRAIYPSFDQQSYEQSSRAFGGLRSDDYLNLLFPNMNQQLLKGNYQGSIVGTVPIFTAKDNVSPLAMMAFRRDQLRAASYAALQDQLKPIKQLDIQTKIPMYGDKLREVYVGGMKYWDKIATQITRQTGMDGWKVLESGKTEYGIMYNNFLSSINGMVNKFDYIALYAAKQQDLRDKGFYVGIDTDATLGKVFQGVDEIENFVYGNDIGSLIDNLGAQMNFNGVLYDAINQIQTDVKQRYYADDTNSTKDMNVFTSEYLEGVDANGRGETRLDAIANQLIAQYPTLAENQDITPDKIKTWIKSYMGVKSVEQPIINNAPKNMILQAPAPDNIDAAAAGAFGDISDLSKGNTFVGDDGSMRKVGGLIEVTYKGQDFLINPANTETILDYMLKIKGYSGEKVDQVKTNLKSQFQVEYAAAFNELTGDSATLEEKSKAVTAAYTNNANDVTKLVTDIVAAHGYGIPVPNSKNFYITKLENVETPDIKNGGVSRQYTVDMGDSKNLKGVILPIDAQTLGNYANNVRSTTEGRMNKIVVGEGALSYYKVGDYMFIPDAKYVQDGGSAQSKIVLNDEPLQIANEDIKVSNKVYKNFAYSGASKVVQSYKKVDKIESGVAEVSQNVTAVGTREFTAKWEDIDPRLIDIASYKAAEMLKSTDLFRGYDWANLTPELRKEIGQALINANPENKQFVVQMAISLSNQDEASISAEYKKLFGK